MKTIIPYFNFLGNTEEAFNFYKGVLGGTFTTISRFGDMEQGADMSEADKNKIMHVTLTTPSGVVLMATDTLESAGHTLRPGDNISLSIDAESTAEADALFEGLSAGGKVTMPLEKTFWGAYFGMLTDKFGIQWMINYDEPQA